MNSQNGRVPVTVPDIGSEADEIRFVGWLKEVGDHVEEDQDLFEIETDKANMVCPAENTGELVEQTVTEKGELVEMGQTVGYIDA